MVKKVDLYMNKIKKIFRYKEMVDFKAVIQLKLTLTY